MLKHVKNNFKIIDNIDMFKCPKCGESMNMSGDKSVVCYNKHNFDLSKTGYANLLLRSVKTEYNKYMFASRNIICRIGFFEPMINFISNIIIDIVHKNKLNSFKVLDVGCGEGSHLAQIINNILERTASNILGVGIDISKDGIQIASKNYPNVIWCVADLTRIPVLDNQFNTVMSILSPANYSEFNRIIADDGLIIKVVPGRAYLEELRRIFYNNTDKETYSNENIIKHFAGNFNILDIHRLFYNVKVNKENLGHLIKMTPLSWGATNNQIDYALNAGINNVTVDLSVIVGRMTKQSFIS
ncbi:MAG: 23S rRNA (guanine(745)-N(1))-methyltransferase [Pelotomaculum sp. PtaB.Bin104]|nr:MAG: 23S rRNA (guanine(745)-N(1))-methyltransferase [Pelotomaculum sp. PtaB.Bin104]